MAAEPKNKARKSAADLRIARQENAALRARAVENVFPGPHIDDDTCFIWVAGRAFVPDAKHEGTLELHVARRDVLAAENAALRAERDRATADLAAALAEIERLTAPDTEREQENET